MIETENHPSVSRFALASSLEKGAVVRCMGYGYLTVRFTEN